MGTCLGMLWGGLANRDTLGALLGHVWRYLWGYVGEPFRQFQGGSVRSNFNSREFNTREIGRFFGHNSLSRRS